MVDRVVAADALVDRVAVAADALASGPNEKNRPLLQHLELDTVICIAGRSKLWLRL